MRSNKLYSSAFIVVPSQMTVEDIVNVLANNSDIHTVIVNDNGIEIINIYATSEFFKFNRCLTLEEVNKTHERKIILICDENTPLESIDKRFHKYFIFVGKDSHIKRVVCNNTLHLIQHAAGQIVPTHLEYYFDASFDGIYITDGIGVTLKVNKAYERITGLKQELLIGRHMKDIVTEGIISKSGTLLALSRKETVTIQQTFETGRKGLITSTPIFDDKNNIIMVITNVRDITEIVHLKENIERNEQLNDHIHMEITELKKRIRDRNEIIIEDEKSFEILRLALTIAAYDSSVLLTGESGVGKEEYARLIHSNSPRSDFPFVKINCGAIPENLIESELFGYEKGSFTGANKAGKVGLFELAHKGTLFLDEIGELPINLQVKLLTVLQDKVIKKVGGTKEIPIDVRIISATNRNLQDMVEVKTFRQDLYYRLNVIPISILPLRERKRDVLPLIHHFINELNVKHSMNKDISNEVLELLYDYPWPGNVRELKNIIERISFLSRNDIIQTEDLPQNIFSKDGLSIDYSEDYMKPLDVTLGKIEIQLINKAYEHYGNVRNASKALGIAPSTFVRKRQKYMKM